MKTNTLKRLLSLVLALMCLVGMVTMSLSSFSAVETDVAQTSAGTKTVYVGVISYIQNHDDFKLHYWDPSGDATLTETDETIKRSVGNDYWANAEQDFTVFTAQVDAAATGMKMYRDNNGNQEWIGNSDFTISDGKILLLFEYGGVYHNVLADYTPSETPTTPTEPTTPEIPGDAITIYFVPNGWEVGGALFTVNVGSDIINLIDSDGDGTYESETQIAPGTSLTFSRRNPADNAAWNTSGTQTVPTDGNNCFTVKSGEWTGASGTWSTYTPSGDPSGETKIIYFRDDTTGWITSDDAKMFVKPSNSDTVEMTESVDTITGHTLWYAEVPANATSFSFYRASHYYDTSNVSSTACWNNWSAGNSGGKNLYKATGSGTGAWAADTEAAKPSGTIEDFWHGIWIDTKGAGDVLDAVRWYKKNDNTYELFLPSYVEIANAKVYTSFDSLTIDGATVTDGTLVNLSGESHTVVADGTTYALNVYQTQGTAAMLMTTNEELYTGTLASYATNTEGKVWPSDRDITSENYFGVYKDDIKTKGSYVFYSETGAKVNSDTKLKSIKGRGNSSFEASMKIYGKYAYNINLDQKATLVTGATASKKWCLLANNVDHTMMRNTFIYNLAEDIGVKYTPNTRLIDLYDNGKYLGAYIITEKVEYGKNTLMNDMVNLDDANEDANLDIYEDGLTEAQATESFGGTSYTYQYSKAKDDANTYITPTNYQSGNFLLEFELFNRYQNEASWFVSSRTGQAVVVKYPEYATQDEMKWIIAQYEAAEAAVYSDDYTAISNTLDVDSFAKMYLVQELSINLDAGATSYYIHNDVESGKLVASPVWDYDWTMGDYGLTKFVFDGTSVVSTGSMANPEQIFVKNKSLKTDADDNTKKNNYNFQAKLVHNATVWKTCQKIWSNEVVDALNDYIVNPGITNDTAGLIENVWLGQFSSAVEMNNERWSAYRNLNGDNWGTKLTSDYVNDSYEFKYNDTASSGSAPKTYANTVYYLNDWLTTRWNYMSSSSGMGLYDASTIEKYEVSDVAFTAVQSESEATLTVTPTATVKYNGTVLAADKYQYQIFVNGAAVGEPILFTTPSTTIDLIEGVVNKVYVKVTPVDDTSVSGTSATQSFAYNVKVDTVNATLYFKSSSSYRYIPKVTVDGSETAITMTQDGSAIHTNASQTQKYYWFKATVALPISIATKVTFNNGYSMNATISLTANEATSFYLGVDNLNQGTAVVDLTQAEENIRNFVKSATHMVYNDAYDTGIATTSIGGKIYKVGDADVDNTLNVIDATTIQRAIAKKSDLSDTGAMLADFDLDGTSSIMDATNVQIYLANNG